MVDRHKALGFHSERYPLSGASRFRGSGHHRHLCLRPDTAPVVGEAKARADGEGFTTLEKWLGEFDALFVVV